MTSFARLAIVAAVVACAGTAYMVPSCGEPREDPVSGVFPKMSMSSYCSTCRTGSARASNQIRLPGQGDSWRSGQHLRTQRQGKGVRRVAGPAADCRGPADRRRLRSGAVCRPAEHRHAATQRTRKPAFDEAKDTLISNVDQLYLAATATAHYTGANLPLFFRDHLASYIEQSESPRRLRNILIVITDGYIELDRTVKVNRQDEGNRTTTMRLSQFRGVPDWEQRFDRGDHGLIVDKKDAFKGLEVLVLEIRLDPQHEDDKNLIFKYWLKWLGEMGSRRSSST